MWSPKHDNYISISIIALVRQTKGKDLDGATSFVIIQNIFLTSNHMSYFEVPCHNSSNCWAKFV